MAAAASIRDALLCLSLIAQPGDVLELRGLVRVQGQQHTTSGYFDDFDAMAAAAIDRSGKDDGVYCTLNPVHPGLLARAPKNRTHRAGSGDTTSDRDVRVRRSILIDVDPVRPAGISSTDAEHDAAIALANQIADELGAQGWPEPIRADSGNGGHLIYAVDLPVEDAGLVKRFLAALSKRYSTAELKVDEKVYNPARISKIYGTLTRKGENTPERPHRYSSILHAPTKLDVVSRETLEAFAPESAGLREVREKTRAHYVGRVEFDLEGWIAEHLPNAKERSWDSGRKWLLPVCPFNDAHDREEAYVCQKHDGVIAAGCQHESCFKSWEQLRERFEPKATRKNGNSRISDREPPHEVLYEDAEFRARQEAEIDAQAARDREPTLSVEQPATPRITWKRAPELVDEIWSRKDDPWIGLKLGPDELCRVRAGGMAVLIGGPASGKTSLAANLLIDHARHVGPAIALSIELPAEELAARIVGARCDAAWEDVLRGQIDRRFVVDALAMPRLYVIDRERASLANLAACLAATKLAYPSEPILVAIDYVQLLKTAEREIRMRVTEVLEQIDRLLRAERVVGLVLSQMGRAGAKSARSGESIGTDASELGAESSAIERFATVTLTIGQRGEPREDGSQAVELSIGKSRMGAGDGVYPMSFWGRSGLWRVSGEVKSAANVRGEREAQADVKIDTTLEAALIGFATTATEPQSRNVLVNSVSTTRGGRPKKLAAIRRLIADGRLVEVMRKRPGAKAGDWLLWTLDRARDAGVPTVNTVPVRGGIE